MDLGQRAVLVVAVVGAAFAAWALVRARRGRLRPGRSSASLPTGLTAGERLTLVQVSSEHCSACAQAARVWRAAANGAQGVRHHEIDAADHLDLVREHGVLTTPTTLVFGPDGDLRGRVAGAPTARQAADVVRPVPIGARP